MPLNPSRKPTQSGIASYPPRLLQVALCYRVYDKFIYMVESNTVDSNMIELYVVLIFLTIIVGLAVWGIYRMWRQ